MVDRRFDEDAKRAAKLLNQQELSGWDLAELTARRTLTVSARHPKQIADERAQGRVSAAEWKHEVETHGGRKIGEGTWATYARCWRRYGENRVEGWSFTDHYQAAWGSEETADERVERNQSRVGAGEPSNVDDLTPTQTRQAMRDPEIRKAAIEELVQDPEAVAQFIEAQGERHQQTLDPGYKQRSQGIDEAFGRAQQQVEEETAAQRWLLRLMPILGESYLYDPEDVFHGSMDLTIGGLQLWQSTLQRSIPFLQEVERKVNQRLNSGSLEVLKSS